MSGGNCDPTGSNSGTIGLSHDIRDNMGIWKEASHLHPTRNNILDLAKDEVNQFKL